MSAASTPLRIGVVGCGGMAVAHHLPAMSALPGIAVVAVADVDEAARRNACARFGIDHDHEDPAALVERDDVDAVAICVPTAHHAGIACAAIGAGKHILIEKPIAANLADADAIIACADAHAVVTAVGHNFRCHPLVQTAASRLAHGELGRIELIRGVWTMGKWTDPGWRKNRSQGGGALLDLAVHHIDLWRHLTGQDVQSISARTRAGVVDDETAVVQATLSGGALASAEFCQRSGDEHEIEIVGERGRLRLSLYRADGVHLYGTDATPAALGQRLRAGLGELAAIPRLIASARGGGPFAESIRRQWTAFAASVRGAGAPSCTLRDGRKALAAALAAGASADRGAPVAVDAMEASP